MIDIAKETVTGAAGMMQVGTSGTEPPIAARSLQTTRRLCLSCTYCFYINRIVSPAPHHASSVASTFSTLSELTHVVVDRTLPPSHRKRGDHALSQTLRQRGNLTPGARAGSRPR